MATVIFLRGLRGYNYMGKLIRGLCEMNTEFPINFKMSVPQHLNREIVFCVAYGKFVSVRTFCVMYDIIFCL